MDIVLYLLIQGIIFGFIGIAIARNKGVSDGTGFFFGFFLSLLGLIIVALLTPPKKWVAPDKAKERPPRNKQSLSDPDYKLWLVSEYNIQRNDVLGEFLCRGELFPTIDDALAFAHSVDLDRQENGAWALKSVPRGCNADKAGLQVGDILVSCDGIPHTSPEDFKRAILDPNARRSRQVLALRNGELIKREVKVLLGVVLTEKMLTEAERLRVKSG